MLPAWCSLACLIVSLLPLPTSVAVQLLDGKTVTQQLCKQTSQHWYSSIALCSRDVEIHQNTCNLSAFFVPRYAQISCSAWWGRDCRAAVCLHLLPFFLCFFFLFMGCPAALRRICCTSHLLSMRGTHSSNKWCWSSTLLFWRWQKTINCIINGVSLMLPASKMLSKAKSMEE